MKIILVDSQIAWLLGVRAFIHNEGQSLMSAKQNLIHLKKERLLITCCVLYDSFRLVLDPSDGGLPIYF